jgi:3-carboxy-cis,cis-muconate cycloisomerase
MSHTTFGHPWLSGLFAAPRITPLWSAEAQMVHLLAFERAWTEALVAVGRVDANAGRLAISRMDGFVPDITRLRDGTARDGSVVPELVRQLREGLTQPRAVHTGATSQDVLDTATMLTLRAVMAVLEEELAALLAVLDALSERFGDRIIMGRTRMQAALSIRAGHRIANWRDPLAAQLADLPGLKGRVLNVQFGGPVGDNQTLGEDADAVLAHLAGTLDLGAPARSWHNDRSGLCRVGGWLTELTGTLGKLGQDVCLMAQQGIGEITLAGGGGSSAMPHKKNPVLAELLVALARHAAGLNGTLGQTLVHEQERSGTAWTLEWMVLPTLTMAAGCATHTSVRLLDQITALGTEPAL